MTRDYHLTQEEAMQLWEDLPAKPTYQEDITNVINAALDKVLGEPVAWAEAGRENNVIANLVKQTNTNEWVKSYSVALYAPKELT